MNRNSANDHQPFAALSAQACELTEAELDAVSGGATGRRMYKPIRITTPVGQASPIL